MPLDATGYVDTKPDVFTLEGLRAWLADEIAAGRGARMYDYWSGTDCLGCRYVGWPQYVKLSQALRAKGQLGALRLHPWTYTAAYDRTVALIEEVRR